MKCKTFFSIPGEALNLSPLFNRLFPLFSSNWGYIAALYTKMYSEFDPNLKRKNKHFLTSSMKLPEQEIRPHNRSKIKRKEWECGAFPFDLILNFIPHSTRKGGWRERKQNKKRENSLTVLLTKNPRQHSDTETFPCNRHTYTSNKEHSDGNFWKSRYGKIEREQGKLSRVGHRHFLTLIHPQAYPDVPDVVCFLLSLSPFLPRQKTCSAFYPSKPTFRVFMKTLHDLSLCRKA